MDARKTSLGIIVGLFWGAVLHFMLGHSYCLYDDAYIYFRFVENTVSGCPLAYNCVDGPVEGFTSPLYFVLLLLGRLLTADLESISQLLGALFLGLAGTLAIWTAASTRFDSPGQPTWMGPARGALVALVLGLDHFYLLYSVIGLETALATLWGVFILRSAVIHDGRGLRALVVAGLFVRPEFALFVLLLFKFDPRSGAIRYWLPVAVAGVVTVGLRWLLFGDFMPNTFWAKSGGTMDHARLGLAYILECIQDFPLVLLSPLALLLRGSRRMVGYLLAASVAWVLFFLRSGGDFFAYSRMIVPLVAALTVLAVVGIGQGATLVLTRIRPPGWTAAALTMLLVVPFAGFAAANHAIPDQHGMARVERWSSVGRFLARHHPGATVAATPVGAIGYFSGARVLDLVGLTDRTVAKEGTRIPDLNSKGKIGHEKVHTDYILAQQPDIIIIDAWKREPFGRGDQIATQFHGEWELMDAIQSGRAPYRAYTPRVADDLYWFMFIRTPTPTEVGEK